ncbi:MAG: alpha/beta hydrolase [Ectothiorhodospiraceae bacterium]|nr:alpha/beta hydrolase [Ectothiorhodospiraceae bacterium]
MARRSPLPDTPVPAKYWQLRNGLTLAGDTWGQPGRQAVVLLHGSGQTRHSWSRVGQRLGEAGYYTIAYDARGHGDSEWDPHGDYSWDALVGDLNDLVHSEQLRSPVFVGASMGGFTGLAAVGEVGVSAAAVVLVDVTPHFDMRGVQEIARFMQGNPEGFSSLHEVVETIQRYQPHRDRKPNVQGLAKNVRLGMDGRYYWHWDPRFLTAMMKNVTDDQPRLVASAAALNCPSLLVQGAESEVVDDGGAEAYLALAPGAEHVVIGGARHMVAGDSNDCFRDAVLDFLRRVAPVE